MPDSGKNAGNHEHNVVGSVARWLLGSCFAVYTLSGQEADALAAAKQKVRDDLAELPNYVCTETVDQSRVRAGRCRSNPCMPENINRVRIDVGYSSGKQIFGWPGGESLFEADINRLVPGLVTDGDLTTLAKLLLMSDPIITSAHREDRNGRAAIRYGYRVPLNASGWRLRRSGEEIKAAYHGSFWVDASSLDVVELRMTAEDLPPQWGVGTMNRTLRYTRARIGSRDFLLPERSVLLASKPDGSKTRTEAQFHNCRQYMAESFLQYVSESAPASVATEELSEPDVPLPDDFVFEVALETEIDSNRSAAGDPVAARLKKQVGNQPGIAFPNGSMLRGRIDRLEVVNGYRYLEIVFNLLEMDGAPIDIRNRKNHLVWRYRSGWLPRTIRGAGGRIHLRRGNRLFFRSTAMPGG